METRVIRDAEEVAAVRWHGMSARAIERQRRQERLVAQAEAVAAARWAATLPAAAPAPVAATPAVGKPGGPTYRLYDTTGRPIRCHLCSHDDAWSPAGDSETGVVRMFVCEHEPVRLGHGLVRQVATVALQRVTRCEATHVGA